jgi:hypothetical protein
VLPLGTLGIVIAVVWPVGDAGSVTVSFEPGTPVVDQPGDPGTPGCHQLAWSAQFEL